MVLAAALQIRADSMIRAIVTSAPLVKDFKKKLRKLILILGKLY